VSPSRVIRIERWSSPGRACDWRGNDQATYGMPSTATQRPRIMGPMICFRSLAAGTLRPRSDARGVGSDFL
jgi:hypothetical protein